MTLISAAQAAVARNLSKGRICILCSTGRIPGAIKVGVQWVLPQDFTITQDPRIGKRWKKRPRVEAIGPAP